MYVGSVKGARAGGEKGKGNGRTDVAGERDGVFVPGESGGAYFDVRLVPESPYEAFRRRRHASRTDESAAPDEGKKQTHSLRRFPTSPCSGCTQTTEQYNVPPSLSITPETINTSCVFAMASTLVTAGPGIVMADLWYARKSSRPEGSRSPMVQPKVRPFG